MAVPSHEEPNRQFDLGRRHCEHGSPSAAEGGSSTPRARLRPEAEPLGRLGDVVPVEAEGRRDKIDRVRRPTRVVEHHHARVWRHIIESLDRRRRPIGRRTPIPQPVRQQSRCPYSTRALRRTSRHSVRQGVQTKVPQPDRRSTRLAGRLQLLQPLQDMPGFAERERRLSQFGLVAASEPPTVPAPHELRAQSARSHGGADPERCDLKQAPGHGIASSLLCGSTGGWVEVEAMRGWWLACIEFAHSQRFQSTKGVNQLRVCPGALLYAR